MSSLTPMAPVVELTAELARIDSTNPTLVPGGAGEAAVGAFVAEWMTEQGWAVSVNDVGPGRPNVVGRIAGAGGPTLLINGHLDTVGAGAHTRSVRLEGDRLHGRGVLDTKGGLAAALCAAASLPGPPPGDVIIAAVCDEEDASIGTTALVEEVSAAASIVLEPTGLAVGVRHRGFVIVELTARGRAAHTAQREGGRNAIDAVLRAARRLESVDTAFAGAGRPEHATVQITRIDGGAEIFTVPDACRAVFELRTVAGSLTEDVDALMAAIGDDDTDGVVLTTEVRLDRPPLETDPGEPIAELVARQVEVAGRGEGMVTLPFWTDAALQSVAGVPSVVFGPGGEGMHSADEHVRTDDLVVCETVLRACMAQFGARG